MHLVGLVQIAPAAPIPRPMLAPTLSMTPYGSDTRAVGYTRPDRRWAQPEYKRLPSAAQQRAFCEAYLGEAASAADVSRLL
jgi:hypothetical protein